MHVDVTEVKFESMWKLRLKGGENVAFLKALRGKVDCTYIIQNCGGFCIMYFFYKIYSGCNLPGLAVGLSHSRHCHSRKSTGITNNIHDCSILYKWEVSHDIGTMSP